MLKIGIIGQQCAGKTTAANFMSELFDDYCFVKFADPIYATLHALNQKKNRAFMQEFGDFAKKHFGEMIFVECFKRTILTLEEERKHDINYKYAIITDDIRRIYEFDMCKELGFKIFSIDAPVDLRKKRAENLGLEFLENHNSETEIPKIIYKSNFMVIDKGLTKEQLKDQCIKAVKQFNLK